MYNLIFSKNTKYLLIIILLNIFSHFIPFERSIISADTFSFFSYEKLGIYNFLYNPDRPIEFIIHELEFNLLNYNFNLHFIYLITSIFILNTIIYYFFNLFFNNKTSFIITLFYSLLPYKIEIYHSSIYAWINLIDGFYILSLLLFIKYVRCKNIFIYIISILIFFFAVMGRESGIFIPFCMLIYLLLYEFNKNLFKELLLTIPYFATILFSIILRLSGGFNNTSNTGRSVDIQNFSSGVLDISNIFFGRYFIKNIVYGLYQFINLPILLILFFLVTNILLIIIFKKKLLVFIKLNTLYNKKILLFFLSILIFSLIPNLIAGSIGGRNTIIACLFIVLIFKIILFFINNYLKYLIVFLLLIISQGNTYSQVISLRLNSSIFNYISDNKEEISNYKNIIINTNDFSKNIHYSLVQNKYNILKTYFGAQTFEDWGLVAMTNYLLNNKNIEIASGGIKENNDLYEVTIYSKVGYNVYNENVKYLPINNTYVINFEKVYKNKYSNGLILYD